MRIGAPVFNYDSAESWALKHVERGYGAAYFPLDSTADPAGIDAYVEAAERHGLVIAEIGAWNNLLDRDPSKREANFHYAVAQLKLADRVGAKCCVNITGSLGERWDGPHPDNFSDETYRRVVGSIQSIIDAAAPKRTFYTVEPMPWMLPHSIEDLSRHTLIAHNADQWRLDGPEGQVTVKINGQLRTNSSEVVREALLAGVGIALRSTWDVGPELKSGTLARVLPSYSVGKRVAVYAVYPSRRHMEHKVRAFVDYLAELYGATPYWDEGLAL